MSVLSARTVRRLWLPVLAMAALLLAVLTLTPGSQSEAATTPETEGVTVSATGSTTAAPDVLRLALAAEVSAPKAGAALAGASSAAARIAAALKAYGVAAADVQTTGLQVQPQYAPNGNRVTGYTARQSVGAVVRNLGRAGATVDAAAAAGGSALRVDSLTYGLEHDEVALTSARKQAFALATDRARTYAEAAGRTLGPVLEVVEGSQAQPMEKMAMPMASAAAAGSAFDSASLQPGSMEASVSVSVRFALG